MFSVDDLQRLSAEVSHKPARLPHALPLPKPVRFAHSAYLHRTRIWSGCLKSSEKCIPWTSLGPSDRPLRHSAPAICRHDLCTYIPARGIATIFRKTLRRCGCLQKPTCTHLVECWIGEYDTNFMPSRATCLSGCAVSGLDGGLVPSKRFDLI